MVGAIKQVLMINPREQQKVVIITEDIIVINLLNIKK